MRTTSTRSSILIISLDLMLLLVSPASAQTETRMEEIAELRTCLKFAIETVSPAVVQFSYGEERKLPFGCGVIVSPEGHIAVCGPVQSIIDENLLELRLMDGRVVSGQALGWSSEFGIGMLKINEKGPWPYVKINEQPDVGEVTVALGYTRNTKHDEMAKPSPKLGVVTRSAKGRWLTTSHRSQFTSHPVFDLDGKLLGLNKSMPVGADPLHVSAAMVTTLWDDLVAGSNLDRVRLFPGEKKMSEDAFAKARAASVRISPMDEHEKFAASGTIVTQDGLVITCGHHNQMPGDKVRLTLIDGRSPTALVLGANLLSDIGVLKIDGDGPWPHVEMGESATMGPGSSCILIGYPKSKPDKWPWVFSTQMIKPTHSLARRDEWYCEFWTEGFPEDIGGASGGGVFDVQGSVIGIMIGGLYAYPNPEMHHARVELFRKNWDELTAYRQVQRSDPSSVEHTSKALKRLEEELSAKSTASK